MGSIVSSFVGGFFQSQAAGKAADAQVRSAELGIEEQRRQFDISRADLAPFREAGVEALGKFITELDTLEPEAPELAPFTFDASQLGATDAFKFRVEQGQQALDRSAAGNRQLTSGNRLIAAQQFGQGLASTEFENEFNRQLVQNQQEQGRQLTEFGLESGSFSDRLNRLASLAEVGQTAATNTAALGASTSANIANLRQSQGQARAAGTLGQANAFNQVIGDVSSFLGRNTAPTLGTPVNAPAGSFNTADRLPAFNFQTQPFGSEELTDLQDFGSIFGFGV